MICSYNVDLTDKKLKKWIKKVIKGVSSAT